MTNLPKNVSVEHFSRDGRRRQTRRVAIDPVHLDLPADLSLSVRMVAAKTGLSPEALLIDVLRDAFEPVSASQGQLALRERG